ncbi:MAG: hypothetical protein R2838_04110 [Caldilineaceae bacterium]
MPSKPNLPVQYSAELYDQYTARQIRNYDDLMAHCCRPPTVRRRRADAGHRHGHGATADLSGPSAGVRPHAF